MNFKWNQKLGNPAAPYLYRWVADFNLFSIRLHHWICGDDPRHFHNHSWNFYVFVLKGSYFDVTEHGRELMRRGSLTFRAANHAHTVETKGCWTLVLTGPVIQRWGFFTLNKTGGKIWLKAKRYFIKYGTHQCN